MDDESADIELLEQHLNRSSHLSTRMTSVLQKFDRRLQKLEKSILPLHNTSENITRLVDNIDKTLARLGQVAVQPQTVWVHETTIMRGLRDGDLDTYTDSVKMVNEELAAQGATPVALKVAETGTRKLAEYFTRLIAEASAGEAIDPTQYFEVHPSEIPLLSPDIEDQLMPVVEALRSLPVPATDPSHPAAKANLANLKYVLEGYADMRCGWIKRCLDPWAKELIADAENENKGLEVGQGIRQWVDALLVLTDAEYYLLERLVPLSTPTAIVDAYGPLTRLVIAFFKTTITPIQTLTKQSVRKYVYLSFSTFGELGTLASRWDEVIKVRTARTTNDVADTTHSMRASCLRVFPEVIADIKIAGAVPVGPAARPTEIGTGLAKITKQAVDFLEKLTYIQEPAVTALRVLGDGNWNMGAASGNMRKVGDTVEVDDRGLLEHFTFDVISNLLTTITTLTKTQRRLPLASIFLINNVSYLRIRLLSNDTLPIDDMLSPKSQSLLNATFRSAKATYLESNFTALISCLSEDKAQSGLGNTKQGTKEKALRFFDCLDEVLERHRFAKVLEDDRDARQKLADDVVQLVVPILSSFLNKHREKEFSKNPAKYIKSNPDEVERQLRSCY